jgi:hypothetical protein
MNKQQNPTEVAHRDLRSILLSGRILLNEMPLTGNELGAIVQGEQMLYEKASRLDAQAVAAKDSIGPKDPEQKPNVVPLKQQEKK